MFNFPTGDTSCDISTLNIKRNHELDFIYLHHQIKIVIYL